MGPTRSANLVARAGNLPTEFFINGGCRMVPGIGADGVTEFAEETINRSGEQAAYTPDWKIVLGVDYRLPVFDRYEVSMNARGFLTDQYFTDSQGFTRDVIWDTGGDVSLSMGFGDAAGTWRVAAWARNLLEYGPTYVPELDFSGNGFMSAEISPSNFMTYGLKFEYSYR